MGAAPSQPDSSSSLSSSSTLFVSSSTVLSSTTSDAGVSSTSSTFISVISSTSAAITSTISSTSLAVSSSALSTSSAVVSTASSTSSAGPSATPSGPYLPIPYRDPTTQSAPPPRKDIDTLTTAELSLFVLAYQQWEKVSATQVGGYFQVAGIHGAPHQYWDNAGGYGTTSTGDKGDGYCFHGDQNFYLWHRPYLALVEQQMQAFALNISSTWYAPQRATYQAAAATLRHPYWDWAKNGSVPATLSKSTITIVSPSTGKSTSITNPLYSHTLVSDGNLGKASNGATITVSSNSRTTKRGISYLTNMQSAGASLKKNTALLFNTPNVCWNVFATYNTDEQQQCSGTTNIASLEGIHNTVHNTISGTMANLDVAAFDPIFWLHHCNVDRIGAIWQAINPGVLVDDTTGSDSTFVVDPGTRGADFQYLPFRASQGNTDWWTVSECYDTRASGYTYPELYDNPDPSTVLSRVNAIYGNGRTQSTISTTSAKFRRQAPQAANTNLIDPPSPEALAPYAGVLISQNGSFHEYAVNCEIQKSVATGTSFDLHLFFGTVADTNYLGAANRVGGFSVSQAGSSRMTTTVSGVVPITDALLNKLIAGALKDLEPDTVQKYVEARLVWRIVTSEDEDIGGDTAASNGLVLTVKHTVVTPKAADQAAVPVVAAPEAIADATNNTVAQPLPSGVAASTYAASATAAAYREM